MTEIVHRAPEEGSSVTACCKRAPFDLPESHRLTVVGDITCPVPWQTYLAGFDEGTMNGYRLAGGDAVARALAVRGDIVTALDAYARARWTHEGIDTWARIAADLLESVREALSGEDADESPDAVVFGDVVAERARQDAKWGPPTDRGDGTGSRRDVAQAEAAKAWTDHLARAGLLTWRQILTEEVAEAFAESDPVKLRAELVQVAAVAVKWVRMIDTRPAPAAEMRAAA